MRVHDPVIIDAPLRFWNGREGKIVTFKYNAVDGLLAAVDVQLCGGNSVVWMRESELVSLSALDRMKAAGVELDDEAATH